MIEIISIGIGLSIQDQGRLYSRSFGIPVSGPMDLLSANQANAIIGNSYQAALLEFLAKGPILKFHSDAIICITGALFSPKIDGIKIPLATKVNILKGSVLQVGNCQKGAYGYIAVFGGLDTPIIFGSRSLFAPLYPNYSLKKGTFLPLLDKQTNNSHSNAKVRPYENHFDSTTLPVMKGPEYSNLNNQTQQLLLQNTFIISPQISRMGYQMETDNLLTATEIITAPVQPGTVQLTPSGKLIILMKDSQTTGGYSRVLQLRSTAIHQLAQMRIGTQFTFALD